MQNIFIIARKELLSTIRQRNLLLIMFLSPIVLVAIMALAFSGLGGSGAPSFADIRVAVVNQDAGFSLQQQWPQGVTNTQLAEWQVPVGGQMLAVGDLLLQNPNLDSMTDVLSGNNLPGGNSSGDGDTAGDFALNFGDILASVLLSQPLTATGAVTGVGGGIDLDAITCPLLPDGEQGGSVFGGASGDFSLDDLLDAERVDDPAVARLGVEQGDYAAAVIIPVDFTEQLVPDFGPSANGNTGSSTGIISGTVIVIGNEATPISASIVRAVVDGVVNHFARLDVALSAVASTTVEAASGVDVATLSAAMLNVGTVDVDVLANAILGLDGEVLAPLGCLLLPGMSNLHVTRQPLDETQARSDFSLLMVTLGGAQAVFFALFTGVFGINSIYEDRRQGTLQRVLASPTPSGHVLWGRLVGNLLIVTCQLLVLLTAFMAITWLVEGQLTFIWGRNLPALLLVVLGLGLFTTGMGVLIVGLAKSSEQVQLIGPLITLLLGAMGGIFGALVPPAVARFSPTWWGIDALGKLGANEMDIGLHLLVLFGAGMLFALVGTFFFRRRMEL